MSKEEKLWPEPAPNWPEAKNVWKWGWPFHVYLFTTLNFLVVLRSLYVMIEQRKSHVLTKDHRFFMNLFLLVFGTTRAVFLLSNPYGSDPDATKSELVICIVTFGIGTACITSAFSFVLLIVLESTRLSLAPSKFQNRGFLLGVYSLRDHIRRNRCAFSRGQSNDFSLSSIVRHLGISDCIGLRSGWRTTLA